MKKSFSLILAALMLLSALFGCADLRKGSPAPAAAPDTASSGAVIKTGFFRDPAALNPHTASDKESLAVLSLCATALYRAIPDGAGETFAPELAEGEPVPLNEEQTRWSVSLRRGALWANGEEITAADVDFTLRSLYDPRQKNPNAENYGNLGLSLINTEEYTAGKCEWYDVGFKTPDEYTIEIETVKSAAPAQVKEFFAAHPLVYEKLYVAGLSSDKATTDYGTSFDKFMSAGRYTLTEWTPGFELCFSKRGDAQSPLPLADKIIYYVFPDEKTALNMLNKGEADGLYLSPDGAYAFKNDPNLKEYFENGVYCFILNVQNPDKNKIFSNKNFREAIYRGLDRASVAAVAGGEPTTRIFGRGVLLSASSGKAMVTLPGGYPDTVESAFDPALANEFLSAALKELKLKAASVTLLYREDDKEEKRIFESLKNILYDVFGNKLTFTLLGIDGAAANRLRRWDPAAPGSFEASMIKVGAGQTKPNAVFFEFSAQHAPPVVFFADAEFEDLFIESKEKEAAADDALMSSLCFKMEKLLLDERVVIPCYETPSYALFREGVTLPEGAKAPFFAFPEYARAD
ncbi:MAG: hypothetical protein IJS65_06340 [Clostridia bacterium]|nr:hypothetical protein [Clostridia bacterium]